VACTSRLASMCRCMWRVLAGQILQQARTPHKIRHSSPLHDRSTPSKPRSTSSAPATAEGPPDCRARSEERRQGTPPGRAATHRKDRTLYKQRTRGRWGHPAACLHVPGAAGTLGRSPAALADRPAQAARPDSNRRDPRLHPLQVRLLHTRYALPRLQPCKQTGSRDARDACRQLAGRGRADGCCHSNQTALMRQPPPPRSAHAMHKANSALLGGVAGCSPTPAAPSTTQRRYLRAAAGAGEQPQGASASSPTLSTDPTKPQ
jgi:hypothetical protein